MGGKRRPGSKQDYYRRLQAEGRCGNCSRILDSKSIEKGNKCCSHCLDTARYKQSRNKSAKKHGKLLRLKVVELLGNKCARCGFSDPRALQIDHIFGGGAKELKKNEYYKYLKRILAMPNPNEKYQILCANCNWIKRAENKETR